MEITLRPEPKQHEAYEALKKPGVDTVFLGGGAGGGKSWWVCESRLINALRYPGYRSFIGREELKRLMQSTYITWNKVCAYHKIPRDLWKLNGQYNYIEFTNGSRIDLLDLKYLPADPLYERFGSTEYTDGAIEEAGEIHFLAYDVLKSRIGRHLNDEHNLPPILSVTGNPKKNWTYKFMYKPWKEGRLPEEIVFIQSLYTDNSHTSVLYGKQLAKIKDITTKERLMYGNWEYDDDPLLMIEYDAIVELFSNKTDEVGDRYLTIDVARFGKDKAVLKVWYGFQVKEIVQMEKCSIDRLQEKARDLCNRHKISRKNTIADEDGVGGGFVDNFKCKGFVANSSPFQPKESKTDKSKLLNYSNLKAQCADLLATKINRREIGIDEVPSKIEEWIKEELEVLKRDAIDDERKFKVIPKDHMKDLIGRSPDFLDAMIMRMWFEVRDDFTVKLTDPYELNLARENYKNSGTNKSKPPIPGVVALSERNNLEEALQKYKGVNVDSSPF